MGVQPSKAEMIQQKQQQQQTERIPAEPQRPACIDALLAAGASAPSTTSKDDDDVASKMAAVSAAECGVIPTVDSIASAASASDSSSASASPTSSAMDVAASSSVVSALTRSSTFQQLASFRHAEAQRRLSLGGFTASAAASAAAASSSVSSAPRSRRRSVIGLQPEDRVSAEDVRRWSCSINQAEAAQSSSPTQSAAAQLHSRSHSQSSLLLSPTHSCSPSTIVRYGVQSAEPLRSARHRSLSSLSHSLSHPLSSSYSSSLRSSHRLHVSSQLAHCANCGRMDHGEVLLWLDSDARTAGALSSPSTAAASAAASPSGLIYCSKDCYWSARHRRGNFDDTAEEEDRGDEGSAAKRAAMQLRLAAAEESFRPLSPSPRVRVILTAAAGDEEDEEAAAAADAALLRKQAEMEGASEIPPTIIPAALHSHSAHTAALAVPRMRRARS